MGNVGAEMDGTLESLFAHASKEDKLDIANLAGKVGAAKTLALALRISMQQCGARRRKCRLDWNSTMRHTQLEAALGDDDPKTRDLAEGLGIKAVPSLKNALRKAEGTERAQILEAIGEVGGGDAHWRAEERACG